MPASASIRLLPQSDDFDEAIERYALRLRAQQRSEHTLSAYLRDIRLMRRVLDARYPGTTLPDITPTILDALVTDPEVTDAPDGRPRSAATIHRMKAVLRSFFTWAAESGLINTNPARSLTTKRLPRKPPVFLTEAEKRRLAKELRDRTSPLARRDRIIFELFLATGIRLQELVNLDVDDVDLDAKHIRIRGKGNIPQVKFIKSSLRSLLRSYLVERRGHGTDRCPALFLSSRDVRISPRQIAGRLSYWLGKAGIDKHMSPHGLRHTFATHLYASTSDLLLVQRALGHRDVSTTTIYTHLADQALEDALERL